MSSFKMTTLKGVFPEPKPVRRKNFIQENVKNLRRMEQCFQGNKDVDELQKLQINRHTKGIDKYQNVTARVNTSLREKKTEDILKSVANNKEESGQKHLQRKSSVPMLDKKHSTCIKKSIRSPVPNNSSIKNKKTERIRINKTQHELQTKVLSDPNLTQKHEENTNDNINIEPPKYKSQGIQTLDDKQIDKLYAEGVIKYPTKKNKKSNVVINKNEPDQQVDKIQESVNLPSDRGDMGLSEDIQNIPQNPESPHTEVDFIKLNKERTSIASKLATQLNNGVPPANYRKGVVPKYIRDRKEALQKEQKAKAAASHPDCPEGHIPLPDDERKATLHMLKKNYQDYINELNMMPIKTDTLRAQRRKIEIEKELNKLEEGIKVFSRPIVYVKINA